MNDTYCYNCDKNVLYYIEKEFNSVPSLTQADDMDKIYPVFSAYCAECGERVYIKELDDFNIELGFMIKNHEKITQLQNNMSLELKKHLSALSDTVNKFIDDLNDIFKDIGTF